MKKGCTLLLLFLAVFTYGQKSTLIQNTNFRAKGLKHSLNSTGDSLVLSSDQNIYKVEIFNSEFDKTFFVDSHQAKVPLMDIPLGRFVTEVKVNDKLILITLLRHEVINQTDNDHIALTQNTEAKKVTLISQNNGKERPNVRFYWIVKNINKGHSSSKIMRIGDLQVVEKMIKQHQIDLKTKAGRLNNLTVWEVYDTTKFMRFKRQNSDYANANSADVDCFNTIPYYKTIAME